MKAPMAMRYTISVTVTLPCEDGEPAVTQRDAEKILIRALQRTDLCDCDAEVLTAEAWDEDGQPMPSEVQR